MPTICLDCRYIGPRTSGIGKLVAALVEHLPGLAPDWEFLFLRNPALGRALTAVANVSEVPLAAAANGPGTLLWLPRLVDLSSVDLFHAPANILPAGLTMPAVTTIHDTMWLTSPRLCNPRLWGRVEQRFYRHGMRRALRQSSAILTPSEATRKALLELALEPGLAERSFVAVPGVPHGFTAGNADRAFLGQLGLTEGRYVLTVGQAAPYKNHAGAIRGFASAFAGQAEWQLVLVQRRGTETVELQRLAASLGVGSQVRAIGEIPETDLVKLYQGAGALLHPSLCEGFGLPVAEAMASGCPVIASNLSAMPEVTKGAALLVDPHDPAMIGRALRRIASESELRTGLQEKGLIRAGELDRRAFAEANLRVYRRVLG